MSVFFALVALDEHGDEAGCVPCEHALRKDIGKAVAVNHLIASSIPS